MEGSLAGMRTSADSIGMELHQPQKRKKVRKALHTQV